MPIHAPNERFSGDFTPKWCAVTSRPQKAPPCVEAHHLTCRSLKLVHPFLNTLLFYAIPQNPMHCNSSDTPGVLCYILVLRHQKSTFLRETAIFDVFCINVRGSVLPVGERKNHKNSRVNNLVREVVHAWK